MISRIQIAGLSCLPVIGSLLNGFYNGPLYRLDPALYWIADFILFVLAPLVIVSVLASSANISPKHYGLKLAGFGSIEVIATSIFFGLVLLAVYKLAQDLAWMLTWDLYSFPDFSYGAAAPKGITRPFVALYWALSAGLTESIFYIGLPWYLWRNSFGLARYRRTFIWASAIVFSAAHWEQGAHGVFAAFAFGITACVFYLKINDLWPIVGAHTLIDLFLFL